CGDVSVTSCVSGSIASLPALAWSFVHDRRQHTRPAPPWVATWIRLSTGSTIGWRPDDASRPDGASARVSPGHRHPVRPSLPVLPDVPGVCPGLDRLTRSVAGWLACAASAGSLTSVVCRWGPA